MTGDTGWSERRAELIEQLGPMPPSIRAALLKVPRHRFVPEAAQDAAYIDEPVTLAWGDATISAPHMVACQLEEAHLSEGLSVLEVGSGSGYLLALMAELVGPRGRVLGLDIEPGLVRESTRILRELGYADRVEVRRADGSLGAPDRAPFDRIVVSCATWELFPEWRRQLRDGGLLLAPVGDSWSQSLRTLSTSAGVESVADGPGVRFVPLRRPPAPRPPHI